MLATYTGSMLHSGLVSVLHNACASSVCKHCHIFASVTVVKYAQLVLHPVPPVLGQLCQVQQSSACLKVAFSATFHCVLLATVPGNFVWLKVSTQQEGSQTCCVCRSAAEREAQACEWSVEEGLDTS